MKRNNLILGGLLIMTSFMASAQSIIVTNTDNPSQLVNNVLVGSGVTISNITYNFSAPAAGVLQPSCGYFNAGLSTFPIQEGIIMCTGNVSVALGPNNSTGASGTITDPGIYDGDLDLICASAMNNEAIIEFDFIPTGDSVVFKYLFASEEYPEYSPSSYNDAFGFFISGPGFAGIYSGGAVNLAQLPAPPIPVTINNVNPTTNASYYVTNPTGSATMQFDGRTIVLTAAAEVQCGETYHIKLAICDAGDQIYDSAVFLEASSFSSNGVNVQIASATGSAAITEACDSAIVTFIRPEDETITALTITYGVGGTALNGTDYPFLPGTITFPIGVDTVQFYITPFGDGLPEGLETVTLSVSIVNSCGDTVTTNATIEINDPLPFNVVPGNIIIDCPTTSVIISAAPDDGVPGFTYDWETGVTTTTASVPGNIVGVTSYDVDITDACGTVASGVVTVTLNPAPVPTIDFDQITYLICPNDDVTIFSVVNNPYSLPVTYDWNPGTGASSSYTVSPNVLTWYYLTINDGCYTVTDSVKVDIGTVDLDAIITTDATNCPGQPGVPGSLVVMPAGFIYTLTGGGDVFGPQVSNTFPNLDGGIIYFLHVLDPSGCTIDTTVSIGLGANAVTATFNVSALQDVTCGGDQNGAAAVLNIGGGILPPYDVTWTHTTGLFDQTVTGVGGGDNINNLFGGNWVVTVTDQEGCAWSTLFNIFEPTVLTLDFISNNPSCYLFSDASVTASTSGGNGSNVFTMTNSAGTQLNLLNTNTINQLNEGWYYTTIVDANGCSVEDSIFIDGPDELAIDWTIDQPLCYGFETGVTVVDTVYNYQGSYNAISYFWNPNPSGNNGLGVNYSNHMGPGSYTLTLNDANGCSNVFDFTIVYPAELVFTQFGHDPADCRVFVYQSGNGVVYAAAGGGTPDYDYLWTNLGTGVTSTNTTWGGLNPGIYSMTVTDENGCTLTQQVTMDSLNPIAEFDVTSAQFLSAGVYEGTAIVDVLFTNQSLNYANPNDPNADTTFFWNLNTPYAGWEISHDVNETFDTSYLDSGTYKVCLVALNKNGCTDTTCKNMIIFDPLQFTPVNVFSPDGDGVNDFFTFSFYAQAVATFECTIVNRWGVVVNVMDDILDEWDGTDMNGDPCTDGIYFYTYSGVATNGTVFSGQGFTYIINS